MKKEIGYTLIIRLTLILLFIYIITLIQSSLQNQIDPFDFQLGAFIDFICYTFIGISFHLISTDLFKRNSWNLTLKPELLLFTVIYFIFSTSILLDINIILRLYTLIDVQPTLGLIPIQIVFGYTIVQLFRSE